MTKQLGVNFDTLSYSKKLEAGGISRDLAQIHAETLAEIFSGFAIDYVTKTYMHNEMRDLEHRLTIKLGGIVVAGVAVLAALMSVLLHTS